MVQVIQFVPKKDFLRNQQTDCCVVNFQVTYSRGQTHFCVRTGSRFICSLVGDNLLDVHRWRKLVEEKMMRIDGLDPGPLDEPQSSIRGFCRRLEVAWERSSTVKP